MIFCMHRFYFLTILFGLEGLNDFRWNNLICLLLRSRHEFPKKSPGDRWLAIMLQPSSAAP